MPTATGADRILTPAAPGLAALVQAFQSGHSFAARLTPHPIQILPDTLGHIHVQSAGSSGQPKVIRRQRSSWQASFAVNQRLFGLGPKDILATLGPLSHSLSLYGAMEALDLGAGFALLAGLRPEAQRAQLAELRVSVLYATPTQLRALLRRGDPPALPALRLGLVGGAKLDLGLRRALHAHWPAVQWREFFGASETSFIALADADTPAESVGRPYPGVDLALRDGAASGAGTLWVQSPYLFDGYVTGADPALRREAGWLTLGEQARQDAQGYLYLAGRAHRQVKIADQLLSLEAVEQALAPIAHPRGLAALTRPDALRGQRLALAVEGEADPILAAALRRHCLDRFGAFAVPGTLCFVARFPVLPAGKLDHATLTDMIAAS